MLLNLAVPIVFNEVDCAKIVSLYNKPSQTIVVIFVSDVQFFIKFAQFVATGKFKLFIDVKLEQFVSICSQLVALSKFKVFNRVSAVQPYNIYDASTTFVKLNELKFIANTEQL